MFSSVVYRSVPMRTILNYTVGRRMNVKNCFNFVLTDDEFGDIDIDIL